jgi:uncharacterized protein
VTYEDDVRAERERRLSRLRDPEGWLSLVGLEWLHEGENRVGADPDADVVLPGADAPSLAGTLLVEDGRASFVAAPRADVTHDDALVRTIPLEDDVGGAPTTLAIGSLRFHPVRRGNRLGVRIRDRRAPALTAFHGLDYFPIDPAWRITARLEATVGRTLSVPDVIGLSTEEPSPGTVVFERDGVEHRLDLLEGDYDRGLFLVFGDATNGDTTYSGGLFLYTDAPDADGQLILDFNLAYNPPCVFSPFATCPLPWPENRLPIRIEAGERAYGLD